MPTAALNTHDRRRITPGRFLRRVLITDVFINAIPTLVLTFAAPWLAPRMGLSSPGLLWGAAVLAGASALLHWFVARRPTLNALRTMSVVDCVLGTTALVAANLDLGLTLFGRATLVVVAVVAFAVAFARQTGTMLSTRR